MSLPDTSMNRSLKQRLQRLWPYFAKPLWYWGVAVVFTIILSLTEPLIPALMQPLLDKGFQKGNLTLWIVPVTIILLFAIRGGSNFIAQMALAKIANSGVLKIRQAMFTKVLNADMGLFRDQTSSALSNILVYEVQAGSVLLVQSIMTIARDSMTLMALISYLMYLNWKLTLIVAGLFPLVTIVMRVLTKRLYKIVRDGQSATDEMAYVVEENVLAHRDIRLYAAQAEQNSRFVGLGSRLNRIFMKSTAASAAMTPITQLLAAVALSAVISVALVQSTDNTTTVGSFAAFITAMLMLIAPVKHLSEVASPVTRGLAAIERGLDLIDHTASESSGSFAKERATGKIAVRNVTVAYNASAARALNEFSLTIAPGEIIALVGSSGSGKTTLVNLLPRFIEPTQGDVTLDDIPLVQWDLKNLRAQIAQVSQHVFLLNDTIAANVALGQEIDEPRVHQCLEAANLQSHVESLPQGIHTIVGHNAMQLSGGQRQRIAIARALYKDAPILILDEATSALDTESERAVQDALDRLMSKRTTIVIAHRLSTVQHANRIVVMSQGEIVEIGNHAELLAMNGHYARLYSLGLP